MSSNVSLHWDVEEIVSLGLICLLLPVVVIGNLMVILSVLRFRRLQIPTNMFITSLSISDILSGLFSPFLLVIELNKELVSDTYLCIAPYCGVLMGISISIITLACIAFDRYTACVFPMEYVYVVTARRIAGILIMTWLLGITLTWAMIIGMADHAQSITYCSLNVVSENALVVLLTVVFLPCGVFIFFCYFKIFMVARHHVNAISAIERSVQNSRQHRHFKRDTKYAKTLGIVITGFLILSLPLEISILLKVASGMILDERIISVCVLLALLNGAINPWIYAYRNSEIRSAFKTILRETTSMKFHESPNKSPQSRSDSIVNDCTLTRSDSRMERNGIVRDVYFQYENGNSSPMSSAVNGTASPV